MPVIPAQTFDGVSIPQVIFDSCTLYPAYVSSTAPPTTAPAGSYYFAYDRHTSGYSKLGFIASPTDFVDDGSTAYRNLSKDRWTYDNKTVYYGQSGDYPNTGNFASAGWTVQNDFGGDLTNNQRRVICWLMIFGGYAGKTITTNLTHVTGAASNPTLIPDGESVTLTFTAEEGYGLPSSITVTNCEYTWDKTTGTLVLSNPTDNVTVTITGVSLLSIDLKTMEGWIDLSEGQYAVQLRARDTTGVYAPSRLSNTVYVTRTYATYSISTTLSHVSTIGFTPTTIEEFGQATLVFEADTGYMLPASITVTGAEYSWDPAQGTLSIYNPTGNVAITISGRIPGVFTIPAQTFGGYQIPETSFSYKASRSIWFQDTNPGGSQYYTQRFGAEYGLAFRYDNSSVGAIMASETAGPWGWGFGIYENPENCPLNSTTSVSQYTFDSKTVYYYWTYNIISGTTYDTIGTNVVKNDFNIPDKVMAGRIAWLMVFGGYTD